MQFKANVAVGVSCREFNTNKTITLQLKEGAIVRMFSPTIVDFEGKKYRVNNVLMTFRAPNFSSVALPITSKEELIKSDNSKKEDTSKEDLLNQIKSYVPKEATIPKENSNDVSDKEFDKKNKKSKKRSDTSLEEESEEIKANQKNVINLEDLR